MGMSTSIIAMQRAGEILGSRALLAKRLEVSPSMISQLCTGARPVPTELAIAVERETGGAVTVEQLRPDIDWSVIRGKPAPTKAAA